MGAWNFVHGRLHRLLRDTHTLRHVSRAESASPASGSAALHRLEQDDLLGPRRRLTERRPQSRKSWARAIHISVDRWSDSTSTRSSMPWNMAPYCSNPMACAVQPEAVGHAAERPVVAGVGGPDRQEGHGARSRIEQPTDPLQRVPQRGVDRRGLVDGSSDSKAMLHVVGQIADDLLQHGPHIGGVPSRERPDVDLELDPVGDHVDLGAGPHDGRCHGGVGAGVGLTGQADQGELVAEAVDAVGVEQGLGQLRREADPLDEPDPCLVQLGLGPVLVDPSDHLGRLDQGVVGPQGLAAVARACP